MRRREPMRHRESKMSVWLVIAVGIWTAAAADLDPITVDVKMEFESADVEDYDHKKLDFDDFDDGEMLRRVEGTTPPPIRSQIPTTTSEPKSITEATNRLGGITAEPISDVQFSDQLNVKAWMEKQKPQKEENIGKWTNKFGRISVKFEEPRKKAPFKAWLSRVGSHQRNREFISQKHKWDTGQSEIEYPNNDEIPGLSELLKLAPLVVPHKLRHGGRGGDSEYDAESEDRSGAVAESPIQSTTIQTTTIEVEYNVTDNSTLLDTEMSETLSPEDERIMTFFGVFFEPQEDEDDEYIIPMNETVDQFALTAEEILHKDPLNRSESDLRKFLSDPDELEREIGLSHRDHGASFLLPVLKAVEYDNNSAPVVFPDIPVNVRVALNVIHLGNFDSTNMEYSIDLEMHMSWIDVRLANNYTKPIRIREKEILDLVWRPDPYFVNSKFSYFHIVSFPNFRMRVMPTGLIKYTLRVTLLPVCLMTFCRHPHDHQQCDLKISSIAYSKSFVNFSWHSSPIEYNSKVMLPELSIKKLFTESCRVEGKLVASSCLRLGIQLVRNGARYIVEKYIPSTLAMMFAWVAPYVPYNYEDVRIITPITVLLTLVQMEKGEDDIHTSYLTSMDIWFVAMKLFSVMSLVESLAVLALIKRSRGVEKQMIRAPNEYEREKLRTQKRHLTGLYHSMDTVSRFLSPLLFIIFFVYYVLYITQRDERTCLGRSIFDT